MELNKENAISAYWTAYKELITKASGDSFVNDKLIVISNELPETLRRLSKMNWHNATLLTAVAVSKILGSSAIPENVSFSIGSQSIPLPDCNKFAMGDAAKSVLSQFREHLNHLPITEFNPCFVNFYQETPNKKSILNFRLNDSLTTLEALIPENFQNFSQLLLAEAFNLLETIGTVNEYNISDSVYNAYRSIARNCLPEIVKTLWPEIHNFPLRTDKSYIENGGDSIQAIRLLSRLQREGYFANLSSLFDASSMSDWTIEYRGKEGEATVEKVLTYPLSATQQLIWSDWSALNQQHIYHEQFLFNLEICPKIETIKEAYLQIWEKYPQLRVSISFENAAFVQRVQDTEADFRIFHDIDIQAVLEADLKEGFGKTLMRCSFIQTESEKYLLWSHHHVLLDGWSVGKLIAEFIEIIEKDLPKSAESTNHQQLLVEREKSAQNADDALYWENFFQDRTAISLPKQSTENGNYAVFSDSIKDSAAYKTSAELAGVSLQSYLLTHFFLTVYSIDGKHKSYLHSISSGRNLMPEYAEEAVGLFIRNIVAGFEIGENDTMHQLLKSFHRNFLKTIEKEFSDAALLNSYQEQRPDVLFVFENYPYEDIKGQKISGNLVSNHELTGYPLSFLLMPSADSLNVKIIYDSGRFSADFIKAFYQKFISLLNHFKDRPEQRIHQLEEQLEKISLSPSAYPLWYDEIIIKTAASKNYISSSAGTAKIAFAEIETLAASFNAHFKDLPKGNRIAVFGHKNEKLPLLAYSIMRNGFVYVPINNAWPTERILKTLAIADCSDLILTDDSEIEHLPDFVRLHRTVFSAEVRPAETYRPAFDDEAYLLFTSGSSGIPKGVRLSHGNLSSFLDACGEYCNSDNYDLIFSFTNIGFDLSIFENLYGLYTDKSIHVIEKPEQLWEELQKYSRVLLNTVPSVLDRLTEKEIANISVVHTAGEPFRASAWKQLKAANPNISIYNWYGPTETTTYSTCIDLTDNFLPSVGRALRHECILLADSIGLEQESGLPGEIIIGGAGVCSYLKNENNKFLSSSKLKFYRTGDRAYIKDGLLFLLGREDRQVKRLGQRFELSEIEHWVSNNYKAVKRVYYHKSDAEYFILFVESVAVFTDELKNALGLNFPAYMLPDSIVVMPVFPENNNGKMDIKMMLNEIKINENTLNFDSELLVSLKKKDALFKSLKGNQSFTAQGGDSILGLRIIGKLKKMGYKIEISDLLNATSLNECLSQLNIAESNSTKIRDTDLQLSPIQKWFREEYQGNANHFNQSVLLELFLPMQAADIFEKIKLCFGNIDILQAVFDGKWKSGKAPVFQFLEIQHSMEITAHCEKLQTAFNLQEGPVSAIALFNSPDAVYLFISIHHFYCDGISWRVLMDHLQDALAGNETAENDTAVFGEVLKACGELGNSDQQLDYYPQVISNPFHQLTVCSYKDSEFRTLEWSIDQSHTFLRNWNPELSLNEKFVSFFMHSWLAAKQPRSAIFLETHGRQYSGIPELSDAIGWFTQFYPLSEKAYPEHEAEIISYVRQAFAALPNFGLSYMGMSNWQKPPFPLLLNFLGSFDENWNSMARPVQFDQSNQVDPQNPMLAFFEINGIILEGKIRWMFRTHPDFKIDDFVEKWTEVANSLLSGSDAAFYSDDSIDSDDLNKISDMLNILDL